MAKKTTPTGGLSDFNKKLVTAINYSHKENEMAKGKKTPRISVNKLAEYLEASPTRRKKIVEDAKNPEKFIVTRYKDARTIIKSYLADHRDEDVVLQAMDDLGDKECETEFQEQDMRLSVESLELMLETDLSLLDGCDLSDYEDGNELINISGVDISVNPDIIVKRTIGGIYHLGAMKLHFSKNNALSDESQNIVSVMLYNYVDSFVVKKGEVANPKLCMSFDIFNSRIINCPTSYKLRMKKIEAACEEIALWWEKL